MSDYWTPAPKDGRDRAMAALREDALALEDKLRDMEARGHLGRLQAQPLKARARYIANAATTEENQR